MQSRKGSRFESEYAHQTFNEKGFKLRYVVYVGTGNVPMGKIDARVKEAKKSFKKLFKKSDRVAYVIDRRDNAQTRVEAVPE